MKKYLWISFVIFVLVLMQTSFFSEFFSREANPNLILAFAFSLIFMEKKNESLFAAFLGGLLIDLLGFKLVGVSSFIFVLLMFITVFVRTFVFKSWFMQFIAGVAGSLIYLLILSLPELSLTLSMLTGSLVTSCLIFVFYFLNNTILQRIFVTSGYLNIKNI